MGGSKIQCCIRIRPTPNFADDAIRILPDKQTLSLDFKRSQHLGHANHKQEHYEFKFDGILEAGASQDAVFNTWASPMIDSFIEGYNGTVLAYGQTGAGKTYTMSGGKENYKQRGVVPRAIAAVFAKLRAMPNHTATIRVSQLEIYNESVTDLLRGDTEELVVADEPRGGVGIRGLSMPVVADEEECYSLLFEGDTNRAIGEHQLNKNSSRSHCVFTLWLELRSRMEGDEKLHLVDLAGSERLSKTKSGGSILKEAQHINKSLSFLEQVIVALGTKNRDHIPYRSSKLTHFLKDSIGGNCKTLMIANIWGEYEQIDETLSTCRLAQRMMRVQNEAMLNVRADPDQLLRKLEREIQELKGELAMHDSFASRAGVTYGAYTASQRAEVREQVRTFLEADAMAGDSISPVELPSIRHMKEVLLQCRELFREAGARAAAGPRPGTAGPAARMLAADAAAGGASEGGGKEEEVELVGEADGDEAFAVGEAPPDARPPTPDWGPSKERPGSRVSGGGGKVVQSTLPGQASKPPPPDKRVAFEDYKLGPGKETSKILSDNKAALKQRKARSKELGTAINAAKRDIDALRSKCEAMSASRGGDSGDADDGPVEMDEEEFEAMVCLKEAKKSYRANFDELKMIKSEVEYTARLVEQATQELLGAFNRWYESTYGREEDELESSDEDPFESEIALPVSSPVRSSGPGDGGVMRGDGGMVVDQEDADDGAAAAFFRAKRQMGGPGGARHTGAPRHRQSPGGFGRTTGR